MDIVAERYFATGEIAALNACEQGFERQSRFIELWTLKEAYLKALGVGFRESIDTFEFSFNNHSGLEFRGPDKPNEVGWRFSLFAPVPQYRLAVASPSSTGWAPSVRKWPQEPGQPPLVPLRLSS
jgi:4'-phosphopantetheinyl transferase